MTVASLDKKEQAMLRRCLAFVRSTPLLDDDFDTRIGVSRAEVDSILAAWPHVSDEADENAATIAINNALNEIAHGLHLSPIDLQSLGSSRDAVQALYVRWAGARGWPATGTR